MLRYTTARKNNSLLLNILVFLILVFSLFVSMFDSSLFPSPLVYFTVVISSFIVAIPLIKVIVDRGNLCARGLLEDTNQGSKTVPGIVEKQSFVTDSYDTIFNALENELLGIVIKPMPLARSVWKHLRSDRERGKIEFYLPIFDAVKPGSYVRRLYLELFIEIPGSGQVMVTQRYQYKTPMMKKSAVEAIEQTDSFIRMIISNGSVKLPASDYLEIIEEAVEPSEVVSYQCEIIEFELPEERISMEEEEQLPGQTCLNLDSSEKFEALEYKFEPLDHLGEVPQLVSDEYADFFLKDPK